MNDTIEQKGGKAMYKYIKQGNIYKLYNNNTPVQIDKELIAFKSLYNAKNG